jgi:hypothetical protein
VEDDCIADVVPLNPVCDALAKVNLRWNLRTTDGPAASGNSKDLSFPLRRRPGRLARLFGTYYAYQLRQVVLEVEGQDNASSLASLRPTIVVQPFGEPDTKGAGATRELLALAAQASAVFGVLGFVVVVAVWKRGLQ